MSSMEKKAVGTRTGGFMQMRRGTRPLHVETLLQKQSPQSASNIFEPVTPTEPAKNFEQSIAATAGDEFQPEEQEKEASKIDFPLDEYESIKKRLAEGKPLVTTRVQKEHGKYRVGQELTTPWGDRLEVEEVTGGKGVDKHPYKEELTPLQRQQIEEQPFDLVRLRKKAELRRDTVKDKPTPVDPTLIESVKIRPVGEKDRKKVFLVDGGKIRNKIDVDFALGGNSARYSYVPPGELWVEDTGDKKDVYHTATHEAREENLMRQDHKTYGQAHSQVSKIEEQERSKEAAAKPLEVLEEVVKRIPPAKRGALFPQLPFGDVWRRKTLTDIAEQEGLPTAVKTYRMLIKHQGSLSKELPLAERLKGYKHLKATGEFPRAVSQLGKIVPGAGAAKPIGGEGEVELFSYGPEEGLRAALKEPASRLESVYIPGRSQPQSFGTFFWEGKPGDVAPMFKQSPRGLSDAGGASGVLTLKMPRSKVLETGKHKEIHPLGERIVTADDLLRYAKGAKIEKISADVSAGRGEFAPGIPIGRVVKKIPSVKEKDPNAEWTASLSLHPAAKRGDHFDLRLVDPKGQAHSWAIQKLPEPGGSTYAAQQPTHSGSYAKRTEPFTIPPNVYGGTRPGAQVEPKYVQPVEVISANDKRVHFLRHQGQETEELVLRRVAKAGDRTPIWALHNATRTRSTQEGQRLPDSKPKYQEIPIGSVDVTNDQQLMTAKLDGAHTLIDFPKADRMVRTYSYRPTQRQSGVIEHTFKFPDFQNLKTPKSLIGTLIRAETWASDQVGKAIPASELGGILNSSVPRARDAQDGVTLRRTGIDVVRFRGKDVSNAPFAQKLEILREVHKATKGAIELPLAAQTPEEKTKLLSAIKAGKLPETKEGVVLHDLGSSVMMKAKVRPDTDVYVREISPPHTQSKGGASGFRYSFEPTGPIVGSVGTGFSQQLRREMLKSPDQFVGRVAKVQSGGQHVSRSGRTGALIGSPAFKEWHIDKTPPELMKKAASMVEVFQAAEEEADPERLVGRLAETRQGKAFKPVLENKQVRPLVSRLQSTYHRLVRDKNRA